MGEDNKNDSFMGRLPTMSMEFTVNPEDVKRMYAPTPEQDKPNRRSILAAAEKCVCGGREEDCGSPEDNFRTIADLWGVYLNRKCLLTAGEVVVNPEDVAAMMALMKIARIATGNYKADNWIDLAGYAACGGEVGANA